ncbi:MAG TPA: phospho-N-acetylmuramoyl-pentapeptide-transferase [Limnochordia bacterium]
MITSLYAAFLAFGISLLAGPATIAALVRLKAGQPIRPWGPRTHIAKAGKPTMGGVLIVLALAVATLALVGRYDRVAFALLVTVGYAVIGLIDDYLKVVMRRSLGLKARHKLVGQTIVGLALALYALEEPSLGPQILIPFTEHSLLLPDWLFVAGTVLVLIAAGNAVNVTDGLDGLAAGAMAIACGAYVLISWRLGAPDMAVFAGAIAGACLGFAWFNAHPAQMIMGDTGALGLGAALGALAVLTRTELLLPLVGGLFVIESLSVILQVSYFRLTGGRRIFLMSPLHHHFEESGWQETKIVFRFWIVALICSLVGLAAVPGLI